MKKIIISLIIFFYIGLHLVSANDTTHINIVDTIFYSSKIDTCKQIIITLPSTKKSPIDIVGTLGALFIGILSILGSLYIMQKTIKYNYRQSLIDKLVESFVDFLLLWEKVEQGNNGENSTSYNIDEQMLKIKIICYNNVQLKTTFLNRLENWNDNMKNKYFNNSDMPINQLNQEKKELVEIFITLTGKEQNNIIKLL